MLQQKKITAVEDDFICKPTPEIFINMVETLSECELDEDYQQSVNEISFISRSSFCKSLSLHQYDFKCQHD